MKSKLGRKIIIINLFAVSVLSMAFLFIGNYRLHLEESEYRTLKVYQQIISDKILTTKAVKKIPIKKYQTKRDFSFGYINSEGKLAQPDFDIDRIFTFSLDKTVVSHLLEPILIPDAVFHIYDTNGKVIASNANNINEHISVSISDLYSILSGIKNLISGKDKNGNLIVVSGLFYHNHIIGALTVCASKKIIDTAVSKTKKTLFIFFVLSIAVNFFLLFDLTRKITVPLSKLVLTANLIATKKCYDNEIPDYSDRHDEIGELSIALREMVNTLWDRLIATENFASDISHEIKNPLSSLRAASETLVKLNNEEKRNKMAIIIRDEIIRLNKLVTDISTLSKLDRELAKEENEKINLADFLTNIIEIQKISYPNITFTCSTDKITNVFLLVNSIKFAQILDNIISNAITFGNIINISSGIKKRYLFIRIDDNGCGIQNNNIKNIFKRFYTDRPKDSAENHSGLGLSISQKIAHAMNGRVFAINRKKGGASFIILLNNFIK